MVSSSANPDKGTFSVFDFFRTSLEKLSYSSSQLFQDLFVLYCLNDKRNGYFVEFGAADGVAYSNSYLLESAYQWTGILSEPAKVWLNDLEGNRTSIIDKRCVWSKSGEVLTFSETIIAELSTISDYVNSDRNSAIRENKDLYKVTTISLNDLLEQHNAPYDIDYLSIDTEGSEFEILNAFDFTKYSIKIITIEHNHSDRRQDIHKLLTENGYTRVFSEITAFDDWYIKNSLTFNTRI